ncbi:MAG TPA: DUF4350 domain-containing protein [Candidatus Angelobacter sp.]|nr:DUF4350 domain-containing protein [Candidatus Angelobacter sp.]
MPMNLSSSDRRLLLWAAVIVTVLVIALAVFSSSQQESEVTTSYSADSAGAKAAFMLLQQQGYKVERWEQSPNQLPADVANTTLVLASPFNPPSKQEKISLQLFLSRGGRILATGYIASLFLPQADSLPEMLAGPAWKSFEPQLVSPLTRAGTIRMSPSAYWKSSHAFCLVHYADGERPVVVSYKVGKGEVIWWASSIPLTNAGISAAGNLALLLNSLGNGDVHILWDEYFHGYRQTLGAYFSEPPLMFGLLQGVLLLLVVVLTFSRRSLPIHPLQENSRLSPLEFVETLGGLYHRAKATHAALEVPYMRFRTIVTRRLGLRTDISADDLARSVRKRLAYKDNSLTEMLRRIEATLAQDEPGEQVVLDLAQELNHHMQNLKLLQESIPHGERVPGAEARAK